MPKSMYKKKKGSSSYKPARKRKYGNKSKKR